MARRPMTFNLDEDVSEKIDELKHKRDSRQTSSVSRSDIANDALELGLVALELMDERAPEKHPVERRHMLQSAVLELFRESEN